MGLPSSLGQLSHYKATDRLPQGVGRTLDQEPAWVGNVLLS